MKNNLKRYRIEKGLSQQEFCRNLCTVRHYNRIENNKSTASFILMIYFSRRLMIPLDDLYELDVQDLQLIDDYTEYDY